MDDELHAATSSVQPSEDDKVSSTPKDAQVMASILKDMGVNEYDPQVVNQMLEFSYKYITTVLEDAKIYSNHASKSSIDIEDVRLAIQQKLDNSFCVAPPRDFLVEIARQKNSTALPLIKASGGVRLPPDRYCLTSNNYRLKRPPKQKIRYTTSLMTGATGGIKLNPIGMQTYSSSPKIQTSMPESGDLMQHSGIIVSGIKRKFSDTI